MRFHYFSPLSTRMLDSIQFADGTMMRYEEVRAMNALEAFRLLKHSPCL